MGNVRILFSLLFLVGCVRHEWSAPLITTAPPAPSTNGEEEEIVEAQDFEIEEGDDYAVEISSLVSDSLRFTLYATSEDAYPMPCDWQGRTCRSFLPEEARAAFILVIRGYKHDTCPRFRLFREDEEIGITSRFRWGCGFILGSGP